MSGQERETRTARRLRTCDVELAAAVETTEAFARWRDRLRGLRVVSAERVVHRGLMFVTTEWRVRLESGDGWRKVTGATKPIEFVELEDFRAELAALGRDWDDLVPSSLRAALRLVLREELAAVGDELAERMCDADPPTELQTPPDFRPGGVG